ncbi:hypothetical protein CWS43_26750 [Rahnella sp. AA]|uniref:hypothetical protein n=1 Tax=Rahnella sp. AA TaxID=2057180 RepID=UPI000C33F4D2|nr:hypothetical protein [Rahnella sp. AA]PKE27449.1 hypothetical protein CWS43_26750 [Rahnella sp. AA]
MDSSQLQSWLSASKIQSVYLYRTVDSSGGVLLLILDFNGHELTRKVFRPQETEWDNTATPKMWCYPPPDEAVSIYIDPVGEFILALNLFDNEFLTGLV